eukprot:11152256-Lingulodinium_polyedra.AAC.1
MEFGIEGEAKFCDPDRDRGVPCPTPESAKVTGCREVYQDHADAWVQIKNLYEKGGGQIYHQLGSKD